MGNWRLTVWQFLVGAMTLPNAAALLGLILSVMLAVAYIASTARWVAKGPALTKLYAGLTNSLRARS